MLNSRLLGKSKFLKQDLQIFYRNGHTIRGKPPGIAKSLEQRLTELEIKNNPHQFPRVNIGFACKTPSRKDTLKERIDYIKHKKHDTKLEKLSRSKQLFVNLEQVRRESETTTAPFLIKKLADHYGIFDDLFGNAFFVPRINLNIVYNNDESLNSSVFHGNILKAFNTRFKPNITFEVKTELLESTNNKDDSYWTIMMVNPDTHLFNEKNETCLNWLINNIPNGEINSGNEVLKYLQPFPVKGMGYQRNIFLLFKQANKMDLNDSNFQNSNNLLDRKFNLLEFYRKHQDVITPVGLSFFQSEWDETVKNFFQERNIREPSFVYDFPKPYIAEQKWFPLRQPFNLYLDKHRSHPDKVNKDYLKPYIFKDLDFEIKYPMAHPIKGVPSWMIAEIKKERLKLIKKE